MTSPTVQNDLLQISASTNRAYAANSKVGDSNLGKDAFLRLMIEQMKSQDPSNPTDNSQMITQTAQFTQVEQLQELNKNMTTMNSYTQLNNVMDRYVELKDPKGGPALTLGVVSEVRVNGNDVSVVLNGQPDTTYPLSLVTKFRDACSTDPLTKPVKYTPPNATANSEKYRGLLNQYQLPATGNSTASTASSTSSTTK